MESDADLLVLLPPGHSVGTIRTRRPVMYVFSGGDEDAAFFSVNGFSLLLDGGDCKEVPFWNLIRNYDKISAVIATRVSPNSLRGISTILRRKALAECHPNFGAFICNLPSRKTVLGDNDVAEMIRTLHDDLNTEGLKPIEAFTNPKGEPITLYEVIGEGALSMIVLNPERGSKDFTALANALKTGEDFEKHCAAASLAILLVWTPSDISKPTTRILYPGACPLDKLYAALEKLKSLEYLRQATFISGATRERPVAPPHGYVPPVKPLNQKPPVVPSTRTSLVRRTPLTPSHTDNSLKSLSNNNVRLTKSTATTESPIKKTVKQPLSKSASAQQGRQSFPVAAKKLPTIPKSNAAKIEKKTNDKAGVGGAQASLVHQKPSQKANSTKSHKTESVIITKTAVKAEGKTNEIQKHLNDEIGERISNEKDRQIAENIENTHFEQQNLQTELDTPISETEINIENAPISETEVNIENSPISETEVNIVNAPISETEVNIENAPISETVSTESPISTHVNIDNESKAEIFDQDFSNGLSPVTTETEENEVRNQNSMQLNGFREMEFATANSSPHAPSSATYEDTPLLESTPLESLSTPIDNYDTNLEMKTGSDEDMVPLSDQECVTKPISLSNDPFCDLTSAFAAGLVSSIVDENASMPLISPSSPKSEKDLNNITNNGDVKKNIANTNKAFNISREDNSVVDAILDDVIESLAGESEKNDSPKEDDFFTHSDAIYSSNNNAKLLEAQKLYEDSHATEQYLPPVTTTLRVRGRPSNSIVSKPKLSNPLYFDIVFIPHHGPHAALTDEHAATTFVSNIRSKRYVLSGQNAIKTYILDGIIAGKNSWNKPDMEIDILPTHDTNDLIAFDQLKAAEMSDAGINLRCSVERCTLRLSSGGADDICSAFKFEL